MKDLLTFLRLLEEKFPYSTMPHDFKGRHGICKERNDSFAIVTVWWNNKCHQVFVDEVDLEKPVEELVQQIEDFILNTSI